MLETIKFAAGQLPPLQAAASAARAARHTDRATRMRTRTMSPQAAGRLDRGAVTASPVFIFQTRACLQEARILATAARNRAWLAKSLGPAGAEADQRPAIVVADHLGATHVARGAANFEDVLQVAARDVEERLADACALELRLDHAGLAVGIAPGEMQPPRGHRVEPVQVAEDGLGRRTEQRQRQLDDRLDHRAAEATGREQPQLDRRFRSPVAGHQLFQVLEPGGGDPAERAR